MLCALTQEMRDWVRTDNLVRTESRPGSCMLRRILTGIIDNDPIHKAKVIRHLMDVNTVITD